MSTQAQRIWSRKSGLYFVLLFGVVNLFADMTYEGARSVTGPFLGMLGASGLVVGTVTGFGEFLGYALRLVSGRWADRSRLYWPITIGGYIVQMVSVPALALSGTWPVAAVLILLERIGRATRNPPRDVMLAQAGEQMGRGWAFGVNEAMDQFGALIGPLAIAGLLAWKGSFQLAFASLAAPALITLLLVFGARVSFPNAGRVEREPQTSQVGRYPPAYWWYCIGAGLVGFGFADFSLISLRFSQSQIVPNDWIAVFYALAMGAGGIGSLVIGKLFDRLGLLVLLPVTIVVAVYAPLAFFGGFTLSLIGALLWGIGLGAHESVMQAAVAEMVSQERLGSAYGVFGAIFGVAWFAGSAALGALYDVSIGATVALAIVAQLHAFADLVGLCQFLPGPASSQVGFSIGLMRAGYLGALAAWAGFTLSSAAALVLFAYGAGALSGPVGVGLLHGLKLTAVAIVAQAVWGMARNLCPDRDRASIAVVAALMLLFSTS